MAAGASNSNKFVDTYGGPMAEKMPKFQLVGGDGIRQLDNADGVEKERK